MIKKIYQFLDKNIEFIFLCFFGTICLLSVLLQVITRMLNQSFPWTEEVSRYSFIWVTFWGMSYAIRNGNHIRFELVYMMLSERAKILFSIIIDLVQAAIFGFIIYTCFSFIPSAASRLAPALNVSKNIVNISCPVGLAFCVLRLLQDAVQKGRRLLQGKAL